MVQYSFKVGTPTGSIQTLDAEGDSPEAARRGLESKGFFVFEAEKRTRPRLTVRMPAFFAARISPRALLVFNQELLALEETYLHH